MFFVGYSPYMDAGLWRDCFLVGVSSPSETNQWQG